MKYFSYKQLRINYKEALNAQRFHTSFDIVIEETYEDGTTELVNLNWAAPPNNGYTDDQVDPANQKSVRFSGEGFYIYIQNYFESANKANLHRIICFLKHFGCS